MSKEKNALAFKAIEKDTSISSDKYYEKIIAEISDMIISGALNPGDKLPSERELAEYFETSRVPVREALKILGFLGLVQYVPGKGMIIRHIEVSSLLSKVFFGMSITQDTAIQLMDIRLLLEPYATEQAAKNATEADLEQIRLTLHEPSATPVADQSIDFHSAVIHASHNVLMEEIYKFLYSLLRQLREANLEGRYDDGPYMFHGKIYEALKNRQGVSARYLMQAHLEEEKTHSFSRFSNT